MRDSLICPFMEGILLNCAHIYHFYISFLHKLLFIDSLVYLLLVTTATFYTAIVDMYTIGLYIRLSMPSLREKLTRMKVLLAEDDNDTATLYNMILEGRGHKVTIANNGQDCLD